jgi:hypothetical protein
MLTSQQRPAPALSRSNWGSSSQGNELDRKLEAVLKDYQQAQGQKRAAAGAPGINSTCFNGAYLQSPLSSSGW